MPKNNLEALLNDIDDLIGPRAKVDTATATPTGLADRISQMTGLPTAVVEGNPEDTDEQLAMQAARAVVLRAVVPPMISMATQEAIQDLDNGSGEF